MNYHLLFLVDDDGEKKKEGTKVEKSFKAVKISLRV